MKKPFLIIALFAFIFSSCEKDPDTITLITNQGGNVTIKVLNDDNTPFAHAKVAVASTIGDGSVLYYDSTNNEGICNIGKLLEGQYEYMIAAYKGKVYFEKEGAFQVISGDSKTVEINPFTNVTKVSVKIVDYYYETPLADISVALIPHAPYYNNSYSFESLINEAYYTGVTNTDGWITFNKVPYHSVSGEYSVMVFTDSNNWDYPSSGNTFYLSSSQLNSYTVRVDL